jgi:hypothetical protein
MCLMGVSIELRGPRCNIPWCLTMAKIQQPFADTTRDGRRCRRESGEVPVVTRVAVQYRPPPAGARRISLVVRDACDGSREDFANWMEAGFVVKR